MSTFPVRSPLPNRVPSEVADARKDNIISFQQTISKKKNQLYVGTKLKVLIEKISNCNN